MNPLLSTALTAPLETLINTLLAQDPAAARRLGRLSGRTVCMTCSQPVQWRVFLLIHDKQIALRSVYEALPDASIIATAGSYTRLLMSSNQTEALFSPEIELSGDIQLIQSLHSILAGLQIDWEDHIAKILGDVATHQLSQWLGRTRAWTDQASASMIANLEEYLHEEARLLPTASELGSFSTRIDELKLAVDRISARQERLSRLLQEGSEGAT